MLSRQEWSIPKYDVFSLDSLIQWLEKQPAELEYDFDNCNGMCLLDQYGTAMGMPYTTQTYVDLDYAFDSAGCWEGPRIARTLPWTFGAALSRARAYRGQL